MSQFLKRFLLILATGVAFTMPAAAQQVCVPELDVGSILKKTSTTATKKAIPRATNKNTQNRLTKPAPKASLYPAKVFKLNGDVKLISRAGQAVSRQLSVGSELQLGDVIQTGRQSFVTILLGSGVTSVLPSNARVALKQASPTVARYELLQGSIENRVTKPPNAKRNTFEVTVPNGVLGVRGTHFTVDYDLGNDLSGLSVQEGVVVVQALKSCTASLIVTQGQSASIGQTLNEKTDVKPILAAPEWMNIQAQREDNLFFEVSNVAGAKQYVAQVARDAEFLDLMAQQEGKSQGSRVRVPGENLVDGFYYVRLAALDERGLSGESRVYLFLRNSKKTNESVKSVNLAPIAK